MSKLADQLDIPGYRVLRRLGRGGMATVYLAIQESVDREVALKVMSPVLAADPTFGNRFLREARIAAQLQHPHIVSVYDVGVFEHFHYIAMQYQSGGKLDSERMLDLTVGGAVGICRDIAAALAYAHSKGFVHRDVKSDNILFDDRGNAVLTDFGIARAADSNTQMTAAGSIIGTPQYTSPEQARGRVVDGRADIYSLGVAFFEMLTGRVPYKAEDTLAVCLMHVNEPIPRLPASFARLQPVVDQLLAKQPDNRFVSGMEVIDALDSLLKSDDIEEFIGQPVAHTISDPDTKVDENRIVHTPRPSATLTAQNRGTGSRIKWWITASVFIISVVVAGYFGGEKLEGYWAALRNDRQLSSLQSSDALLGGASRQRAGALARKLKARLRHSPPALRNPLAENRNKEFG